MIPRAASIYSGLLAVFSTLMRSIVEYTTHSCGGQLSGSLERLDWVGSLFHPCIVKYVAAASHTSCSLPRAGQEGENSSEAVAHPGYEVERPFTMLRYVLVGMIAEIVDRDPTQLEALPVELWKVLCSWFFRYPHNNLYHSVFYKLVFKALRCNSTGALRMAISKGRLVAQLVDCHLDGDKVCLLPLPCKMPADFVEYVVIYRP